MNNLDEYGQELGEWSDQDIAAIGVMEEMCSDINPDKSIAAYLAEIKAIYSLDEIGRLRSEVEFLKRLVMNVAMRCVREPDVAAEMVADERERTRA